MVYIYCIVDIAIGKITSDMSKNVGHFLNYLHINIYERWYKKTIEMFEYRTTLALLPEGRKSEKVDILLECLVSAAFD